MASHAPRSRRFAHRAHPLTSIPEHCAVASKRLTIDLRMDKPAPAQPAALLEREHEVERVRGAVDAAGQGAGGVLVIEGSAGIGKSRLLEEARDRAADRGLRVLNARATELEQGFPFGVVQQLFERPLLEADSSERERWLAGAASLARGRAHRGAGDGIGGRGTAPLRWRSHLCAATRPVLARVESLR